MEQRDSDPRDTPTDRHGRRGFLSMASLMTMFSGLFGSYGMLAYLACRFLYPAQPPAKTWMFVTDIPSMRMGASLLYQVPSGEKIVITR